MDILDTNDLNKIEHVEYANFGHRFLAGLVDFFAIIIPAGGSLYFSFFDKNLTYMLICNIIIILYKPLMEGIYGATLGKMAVGIKMVDSNHQQIDLVQSFTKNGIYIVSGAINIISAFWMFGLDEFLEAEGFMESSIAVQDNPYSSISMIVSLLILISCLVMLASDKGQTLHDRIAKTFCIRK